MPSIPIKTDCYNCRHMREVPGNAHIACVKPDPAMTGAAHGIRHGWFMYPFLFDPIWRTRECANFKALEEPSCKE